MIHGPVDGSNHQTSHHRHRPIRGARIWDMHDVVVWPYACISTIYRSGMPHTTGGVSANGLRIRTPGPHTEVHGVSFIASHG